MNKNKKILVASLLSVASIATIGSTFAFNGSKAQKPQLDDATRTAIHEAMTNGDYTAFQKLTSSFVHNNPITPERFQDMAERFKDQWSMNNRNWNKVDRQHNKNERRTEMQNKREKMMAIMDQWDYNAWKDAAPEEMTKIIDTEAKFTKLLEAHQYMQKAKTIREELWLEDMHQKMMNQDRHTHWQDGDQENMRGMGGMRNMMK